MPRVPLVPLLRRLTDLQVCVAILYICPFRYIDAQREASDSQHKNLYFICADFKKKFFP